VTVRGWVRVLHRDVGYFLAGLVVCFSISGVAVNHVDAWNPNYARTSSTVAIGPLASADLEGMEREVVARVPLDPVEVRGRRRASETSFQVFLDEGGEVVVDPRTGTGTLLRIHRRTLLFETNVLHLNHLKGAWTFVSDAFAVLLAGLAITGLFMLKGEKGLAGRGKWFVAGGLVVPVAFVIHYYATR
jgi:hypothetical protein